MELVTQDNEQAIEILETHKRGRVILFQTMRLGMGQTEVDSIDSPSIAVYSYPPMLFIAGDYSIPAARQYIESIPPRNLLVVPDENWSNLVKEAWSEKIRVQSRTRMNHESLDIKHILKLKAHLQEGYFVEQLDKEALERTDKSLLETMHALFGSKDAFLEKGYGFYIEHEGNVVSIAHTAFPFTDEFEIQVSTINDEKYRRKGLATIVCSALIELAFERGHIPHWDAANEASVALAIKLGYSDPDPWEAFFFTTQ